MRLVDELSDQKLIEECLRRISKNGCLLLEQEVFVSGIRHDPATYILHQAGPSPSRSEPAF